MRKLQSDYRRFIDAHCNRTLPLGQLLYFKSARPLRELGEPIISGWWDISLKGENSSVWFSTLGKVEIELIDADAPFVSLEMEEAWAFFTCKPRKPRHYRPNGISVALDRSEILIQWRAPITPPTDEEMELIYAERKRAKIEAMRQHATAPAESIWFPPLADRYAPKPFGQVPRITVPRGVA